LPETAKKLVQIQNMLYIYIWIYKYELGFGTSFNLEILPDFISNGISYIKELLRFILSLYLAVSSLFLPVFCVYLFCIFASLLINLFIGQRNPRIYSMYIEQNHTLKTTLHICTKMSR